MTPSVADRVFVVRVDSSATIVALVDVAARSVRRVERHPGGLADVDEVLEGLIADAVFGGLPESSAAPFVQARTRLREAIAAARGRLADGTSTIVPVRFPGRMDFVTIESPIVTAALSDSVEAVIDGLHAFGAGPGARVVPLAGVDSVPGLLERLPGQIVDAAEIDVDFDALLDDAPPVEPEQDLAEESVDPEDSGTVPEQPARTTSTALVLYRRPGALAPLATPPAPLARFRWIRVPRRAWPTIAAALVLLTVGGAGVVEGIGDARGSTPPASTVGQVGPPSGVVQPSATPGPDPASSPIAGVPAVGAPSGGSSDDRSSPKRRTTVPAPGSDAVARRPDPGAAPPTAGSDTAAPPAPSDPAPTPPPSDPTTPPSDPTPDPSPTDPGLLCDLLCPVVG